MLKPSTTRHRRAAALPLCILTALIAACGSADTPAGMDATAIILTRLPTLQAQMTQNAPALQTVQSQQLTQNAPTVQANMTLLAQGVVPTTGPAAPASTSGSDASGGATGGTTGGAPGGIIAEGTTESGFPVYGEGYATTRIETITLDQSITGTMTETEAHNFLFDGTAGQTITIRVNGSGGGDPRVKLIDPHGELLAQDDDGGGRPNALLTYSLPETGTYTIRIDMFTQGGYTLTVQ